METEPGTILQRRGGSSSLSEAKSRAVGFIQLPRAFTEDLGDKDQFVKPFAGLLCLGEMAIMQKWAKKQIVSQKYMIISVPLSRSR